MARQMNSVRRSNIRVYLIILIILVLGTPGIFVTISQIYSQHQYVLQLTAANSALRKEIDSLEALRRNWDDPNYVSTQGRKRFYLLKPGEVGFLLINDVPQLADEKRVVNKEIVLSSVNWGRMFLESIINAGPSNAHYVPK
ncbi:septum formation initiator family protein [Tropheryma whipplei]|nr:septum formation initiator family protein [Tropheryma whipplei]